MFDIMIEREVFVSATYKTHDRTIRIPSIAIDYHYQMLMLIIIFSLDYGTIVRYR